MTLSLDKTLLKGIGLIEALANSDRPRGVTELARELKLNKSNIHRTLATLVASGYVRRDEDRGHYELTIRLWGLGSKVISRLNVKSVALPFMQRLAAKTRETVHLSVLDGLSVVYIDKIDSPEPVRAYSTVGGRSPAYCVATGKALLAFQPSPFLSSIPAAELQPHTDRTITRKHVLLKELERIRHTGYSVNRGEWRLSVRGVAAPLFDFRGCVVAAIGLSGPGERFNENKLREYGPLIRDTGQEISREMGCMSAYPPQAA